MTSRQKFLSFLGIAVLATGVIVAAAQDGAHERHLAMIGSALDLTDAQKETAKTLFKQTHDEAQPILDQLKQGHENMAAAIKAGKSDAELTQIATSQGVLMGQLAAIHAKGLSKFYAQLTPQQREKADQMHDHFKGMMQQGSGAFPHHGF